METIFKGIFDSDPAAVISVKDFMLCMVVSLLAGLIMALCYMIKSRYTKSFILSLALLPSVVCVVIMMVNGNVGAGVAVAGAFSLVRFRSAQGSAKEIVCLFLAMGAGLISGMGYLTYSILFTLIMSIAFVLYNLLDFGTRKQSEKYKTVRITIPEDLDYTGVFDGIFKNYTKEYELTSVKTTNMGSMFRLTYDVVFCDPCMEKEFIDELRIRNGNLEITVSKQAQNMAEL